MKKTWTCTALALLVPAAAGLAQEKTPDRPQESAGSAPRKPVVPLKVQLVLTKLNGEAKVASLPYTVPCNADDRVLNQLRMGIEVPVITALKDGPPSYQYRNVGTNIDCRAYALDDGRFRLEMSVEHSSIYARPDEATRPPLFRTFRTAFVPILREGQTLQYTVAADPVSGETVKIDVTLTALK